MPKGKLRISKKCIINITTIGLAITIGFTGLVHVIKRSTNETPDINVDTQTIVATYEDSTQLDEVLEKLDQEATMDLDELEEIVNLSERLHNINLEQYIGSLEKYSLPENYRVQDLHNLLEIFDELSQNDKVGVLSKEDREFTKLCLILESYERATNNLLSNNCYSTLIRYGSPTVKAKLLDACGFSANEVSNIRIGAGQESYVLSFTDNETGKMYNVPAEKGSKLNSKGYVYDVINSIYDWRDNTKLANNTGDTYDGDRNKDILDGINMLKTLTLMDCEINTKGKIVVKTTMSEVKDKVKALTKEDNNK